MLTTSGTELLSINEAAEALQCSRAQVYRLYKDGLIALLRHNGHYWLEPSELEDYFARLSAEARKERVERRREAKRRTGTAAKSKPRPSPERAVSAAPEPTATESEDESDATEDEDESESPSGSSATNAA